MTKIECTIDVMEMTDWHRVRSVYLEGIATGHATFETQAPDWKHWDSSHLPHCRLVARTGAMVAGWAALKPVSTRRAYVGVAETSIYVAASFRGQGTGQRLLDALINCSEQHGIWTLQAGIFPENNSSLVIHQRSGFREVGRRERIGKLDGIWRDVVLLERRSPVVGQE